MERHIGLWSTECEQDAEIAELIIDGNSIEFYRRKSTLPVPTAFIGGDGERSYKVFTNGVGESGKNRTLSLASSYKVAYLLMQNCKYEKGMTISNIESFSFVIPELIDWIAENSIEWGATENHEIIAAETKKSPIVLKNNNPSIEIYFEAKTSIFDGNIDSRTSFRIENCPRIMIKYETPVTVVEVNRDIQSLMQFFGLLIGHVSDALDIRLDIKNQDMKGWLYINEDFSYNLRTIDFLDKPRTVLKMLKDKICCYFESWYNFYYDDRFELIRRMYFRGNNRKDIFAQDILVQYVRILEGYNLRITGDEEKSAKLENSIKEIEKEIKALIFSDEGKPLFSKALSEVVPEWKYNSSHAGKIASWIARGYLGKKGLSERLKNIDNEFFNIIASNAIDICSLGDDKTYVKDADNGKIVNEFYRQIVATRNYYSHYKTNFENLLNFTQVCNTINVLKALLIMIFYSHMGMEKEDIRKIIIWDSELHFQTMCLRNEEDRPYDIEND